MSGKRLAQVESVYHAVLGQPPERRAEYLREACGDDDELRSEVESLLRYEPEASDLLEAPLHRAMAEYANGSDHVALSAGQRIGTYLVGERLGAGGMGEVFRAHDTRLRRDVAIKVLPSVLASDRDRLARLEREARLLAALNHPNIAAIYGLETLPDSGAPALILELVPGDTLAERIAAGALPPKVALAYARQIVDALDAAHERGIIHRDLKPTNVKVTPEGVIKVLDFGLARNIAPSGSEHSEALTAPSQATRQGVAMGTVAYMSPEQARGLPVDKRTDIWAFGCVLYEMLTGRAAFARATVPDTLAGALEGEPDWGALPASLSPLIAEGLKRCLEKPVSRRLRDIADVTFALEGPISGSPPVTPRHKNATVFARRGPALLTVCGLLAIGIATGWFLRPRPNGTVAQAIRVDISPPLGSRFVTGSATISSDGAVLAFVAEDASGNSRLWVRPIRAEAARELPSTEGATSPFWSPV